MDSSGNRSSFPAAYCLGDEKSLHLFVYFPLIPTSFTDSELLFQENGTCIAQHELDSSNGVLIPFYDADTNVVYVSGKVRDYHPIIPNLLKQNEN